MPRYVIRDGHLVEKHLAPPKHPHDRAAYVISDAMDFHIKHPGTGAMIDSKAKFRQHTRDSGCVEVGTDPAASIPRPKYEVSEREIVDEVKRSIAELNSR